MAMVKLEVSKNVPAAGGASVREKVGDVEIYVPTLKEIGIEVEPVSEEKDGTLNYADNTHSFIYSALLAAAKQVSRNKLKPGTVEVKPGNALPTNLVELVTPSENTGNVLTERRNLLAMFKDWLVSLEKPENVKALLRTFLEKPETLLVQPLDKRAKIKPYYEAFGTAVEEKLSDYQGNYLMEVLAKCDEEEVEF